MQLTFTSPPICAMVPEEMVGVDAENCEVIVDGLSRVVMREVDKRLDLPPIRCGSVDAACPLTWLSVGST